MGFSMKGETMRDRQQKEGGRKVKQLKEGYVEITKVVNRTCFIEFDELRKPDDCKMITEPVKTFIMEDNMRRKYTTL